MSPSRLLHGRIWTSLLGPGFLGGLIVAIAGPLIVSLFRPAPTSSVTVPHPPVAVIESRRQALTEAGAPIDESLGGLDALGVAITATVDASGYRGKELDLECAIFGVYPDSGFHSSPQKVTFRATNEPVVTAPCWIPLPASSHPSRYNAVVLRIEKHQGKSIPTSTLPVTPFTAPPVNDTG
jgi:hypothetical protein